MWRNRFSIMLCVLLALPAQAQEKARPTVQKQVGEISSGTIVQVKTRLKDMKNVTGRLGTVTAEGFEVQTTKGQKVDTVKLNFADVKGVREKNTTGNNVAVWVWAGIGIGVAVLLITADAIAAGS